MSGKPYLGSVRKYWHTWQPSHRAQHSLLRYLKNWLASRILVDEEEGFIGTFVKKIWILPFGHYCLCCFCILKIQVLTAWAQISHHSASAGSNPKQNIHYFPIYMVEIDTKITIRAWKERQNKKMPRLAYIKNNFCHWIRSP